MNSSTKTDWNRLKNQKEKDIDYSDIPKTNSKFWEDAQIYSPHKKVELTINIDDDLAIWIKSLGENSNLALNNILRAYYLIQAQS